MEARAFWSTAFCRVRVSCDSAAAPPAEENTPPPAFRSGIGPCPPGVESAGLESRSISPVFRRVSGFFFVFRKSAKILCLFRGVCRKAWDFRLFGESVGRSQDFWLFRRNTPKSAAALPAPVEEAKQPRQKGTLGQWPSLPSVKRPDTGGKGPFQAALPAPVGEAKQPW